MTEPQRLVDPLSILLHPLKLNIIFVFTRLKIRKDVCLRNSYEDGDETQKPSKGCRVAPLITLH